jgi:peptidoglycan/xylan/chitin deacetylase (PgdA/CDA1 family)
VAEAQSVWPNGARCAISLSYDGALDSHLDRVWPVLQDNDLAATFYITPPAWLDQPLAWMKLAREGHEIGNHSFYGVSEQGLLEGWTLEMVEEDLLMAEAFIKEQAPEQGRHSFAYPGPRHGCIDLVAGEELSYRHVVDRMFRVSRSAVQGWNAPATCDLRYLKCFSSEGRAVQELLGAAEAAVQRGDWLIYAIGGVGDETETDSLYHAALCEWLAARGSEIWVRPVIEVGTYLEMAQPMIRVID